MSCPHTEVMETVVTTTTEQSAWGEVINRTRSCEVTYRCVECGELVGTPQTMTQKKSDAKPEKTKTTKDAGGKDVPRDDARAGTGAYPTGTDPSQSQSQK